MVSNIKNKRKASLPFIPKSRSVAVLQ